MATNPASKGGHWDAKDHAYEYPTKQPGTHYDVKDKMWEGPKQKGPMMNNSKSAKKAALFRRLKKKSN